VQEGEWRRRARVTALITSGCGGLGEDCEQTCPTSSPATLSPSSSIAFLLAGCETLCSTHIVRIFHRPPVQLAERQRKVEKEKKTLI
jgi:hypothetical protein